MINLCLVRHGNTDWNNEHRIQGWTDVSLNKDGIIQAQESSELISSGKYDLIISSDLLRAWQTANIISNKLSIPIIIDEALRERKHGILEGKSYAELKKDFPTLNMFSIIDGRETIRDFVKRVRKFWTKLEQTYDNKNIIIVTHGGVLKVLFSYYIEEEYVYWKNGEVRYFEYGNGKVKQIKRN